MSKSFTKNVRKTAGSMLACLLVMAVGLIFVVAPFFAAAIPGIDQIPQGSLWMISGFGIMVLAAGAAATVFTQMYVKAEADLAWVRTGRGGQKAVIDGGMIVVPILHSLQPVSLNTLKIPVDRRGGNSLITADKLRADVVSEFYINVQKDADSVKSAATTLGDRCVDPDKLKAFMEEKLVSALRTVAATKTLNSLNSERDKFAEDVQRIVQAELKPNGLNLESVTISHLDQTPPDSMDGAANVFDAEGLRTITEITQRNRIERNKLEREAELAVKQRDVETAQAVYAQEVDRANAEAAAESEKRQADVRARAEADKIAAEQARMAEVAAVEKERAVEVAGVERTKAVEVADQQRQQATETASIEREKAIEIAAREKEIQVAEAEKRRADAQGLQLEAEREREERDQAVKMVSVTQEAERAKAREVIAKEAEAQQLKLEENAKVDVEAYKEVTSAAAAEEAAVKEAAAIRARAEAEKDASVAASLGLRANEMVPVEVERERVNVRDAEVTVLKRELEAKTENEAIARELEISLAQIAAGKDAQIAAAEAFGRALGSADMTIYGSPETMAQMQEALMGGIKTGTFAQGLVEGTPDEIKLLAMQALQGGGSALKALFTKLTGTEISDDVISGLTGGTKKGGPKKAQGSKDDGASA